MVYEKLLFRVNDPHRAIVSYDRNVRTSLEIIIKTGWRTSATITADENSVNHLSESRAELQQLGESYMLAEFRNFGFQAIHVEARVFGCGSLQIKNGLVHTARLWRKRLQNIRQIHFQEAFYGSVEDFNCRWHPNWDIGRGQVA
jgi:hypothetical protein